VMISEILLTGAENAQRSSDICRLLNISARDLSAAVEAERRDGKPICASTGSNPGYFLAKDKAEMKRYCRSLFHRAGEIHKTRKACMETLENLPEQREVL